jgi:hypothetical protein
VYLGQLYESSPAFKQALRLFLRSPQTRLVRHICASLANDPNYLVNNRRSIEQAVHSILAMQGIDPEKALEGSSVLELIRVAGGKLNIKVSEDRWTMVTA